MYTWKAYLNYWLWGPSHLSFLWTYQFLKIMSFFLPTLQYNRIIEDFVVTHSICSVFVFFFSIHQNLTWNPTHLLPKLFTSSLPLPSPHSPQRGGGATKIETRNVTRSMTHFPFFNLVPPQSLLRSWMIDQRGRISDQDQTYWEIRRSISNWAQYHRSINVDP